MTLYEYIEMLQRKHAKIGHDIDIAFTQAGYYSDGPLADLYEDPQIEEVCVERNWDKPSVYKPMLVLGHSFQSY